MADPQISADRAAHLIFEALEQLGWNADAEAVATRVARLSYGLPAEDEFSVLLSWLGRCRLVHKLDQSQAPPNSVDRYQVPDLLAILSLSGREQPVLIEVKSKAEPTLAWKPRYLTGLRRYGAALGLPVLVAWKFQGIWSLVELRHFRLARTNYHLTFATAQRENLLSTLCGDFAYVLQPGVGLHVKVRKDEMVAAEEEGSTRTETWKMHIEDAHFTNGAGKRVSKLGPGLWPLFLASPMEEQTMHSGGGWVQSFVTPSEGGLQFAHRALVTLLGLESGAAAPIHWRSVLAKHTLPVSGDSLRRAAIRGIDTQVVRYVLDQQPQTPPAFTS